MRATFNYEPPPNTSAKLLLLTDGMICIVGRWGDGDSVIAWAELPERDKQIEKEKGLI